ncbi:MAG: ferredoxin [Planctomycetota bacterium]
MTVTVDKELCSGCGLCTETCPDVFEMIDDIAKVKVSTVPANAEPSCKEAAEGCPTEAIKIA